PRRGYAYLMRISLLTAGLVFVPAAVIAQASSSCATPHARTATQVDTLYGTPVSDPYRWLENTDAAETHAWVEAENCVTFGYLGTIPERDSIRSRLTQLWNYERYGVPQKKGGLYIWSRNDGLQNQSVLYMQRALGDEPRVLIDPNRLSTDGTVALTGWDVS